MVVLDTSVKFISNSFTVTRDRENFTALSSNSIFLLLIRGNQSVRVLRLSNKDFRWSERCNSSYNSEFWILKSSILVEFNNRFQNIFFTFEVDPFKRLRKEREKVSTPRISSDLSPSWQMNGISLAPIRRPEGHQKPIETGCGTWQQSWSKSSWLFTLKLISVFLVVTDKSANCNLRSRSRTHGWHRLRKMFPRKQSTITLYLQTV